MVGTLQKLGERISNSQPGSANGAASALKEAERAKSTEV